MNIQGI